MPRCGGMSLTAGVLSLPLNESMDWFRFLHRKMNIARKMMIASPATLPTTPPATVDGETGGPLLSATLPTAAVLDDAALELEVAPTPPPFITPLEVDAAWYGKKVVESSEDGAEDVAVDDGEDCREGLGDVRARTVRDETAEVGLDVEAIEEFEKVWFRVPELRLDIKVVVLGLITKVGKVVGVKGMEGPPLGVGCNDCDAEAEFGEGGTIVDDAAAYGNTVPGLGSMVVAAASLNV